MVELRPGADVDADEVIDHDRRVFNFELSDEERPLVAADIRSMVGWAAVDGGRVVGFVGARDHELTMPGSVPAAVGGVTWVSVAPTHRRQGIVSRLMGALHDDLRRRGHVAAVLVASEAGIYGRFGYGVATFVRDARLDRRRVRFRQPMAPVRLAESARYVDVATWTDLARRVFDRYRRAQVGALSRHEFFWSEAAMAGAAATGPQAHRLVWEEHGEPRGVASYEIATDWDFGHPAHRLTVSDLVAVDDVARSGLWQVLCGVDLVSEVATRWLPLDDPLPWELEDPRALRTRDVNDFLWLCPLDVGALLAARRYGPNSCGIVAEVEVEVEVDVELEVEVEGAGRFEVDAEGARPARRGGAGGDADLRLGRAELGSVVLGGVAPSTLQRAGRVRAASPATLAAADRLFGAGAPEPFCNTAF